MSVLETMENVSNVTAGTPQSDMEHPLNPALSYTLASLQILTTIFTFLGNVLVITIIVRSPKIQNITSGFLLNLAVADLSTGLLLIPFATDIQVMRAWTHSDEWCGIIGFVYMALGIVSTWTLASLSMERYVAVNHPLKYHSLLNKSRALIVVVVNWILALFMASVPYMAQSGYTYLPNYGFCLPNFYTNGVASIMILTVGICLPFVIMCLAYISIGRVACTQARRKVVECNEEHCAYVTPKTKDYRAAKILAGLAGVFAVCWLPFTILCCLTTSEKKEDEGGIPPLLTSIVFWFSLLSSAINPWLYSILNRAFRTATRQLLSQAYDKFATLRSHFRVGPTAGQRPQSQHGRQGKGRVGGGITINRGSGVDAGSIGRGSNIEMSEHKGSQIQTVNEDVQREAQGSGSTKSGTNNSKLSVANDETNTVISSASGSPPRQSSEKQSETGDHHVTGNAHSTRDPSREQHPEQQAETRESYTEENTTSLGQQLRERYSESGKQYTADTNSTAIPSDDEV